MIIIYSKPAYGDAWETTPMRLYYCNQMRIAEYAATFRANQFTSVWLVPGTGENV